MINGTEIRAARERAGLTQGELATRVGVSLRTVGNWERGETVPQNRASVVERVLADWLDEVSPAPRLTAASDAELLAEIARRFARVEEDVHLRQRSLKREREDRARGLLEGESSVVSMSNKRSTAMPATLQDRYDQVHDELDSGALDAEPFAAGTGDERDVEQPGPEGDDEGR